LLVLRGAQKTLSDPRCISVLVELYPGHKEYEACLAIVEGCGFSLIDEGTRAENKAKNFIFAK
jgi:hypothetical protein